MRSRQSQIIGTLAVIVGYGAILGYGTVTETVGTNALVDIYFGLFFVGAAIAGLILEKSSEKPRRPGLVAFLIAGVALGLNGFSMCSAFPSVWFVDSIADVALIGGCVLIIYRNEFSAETA